MLHAARAAFAIQLSKIISRSTVLTAIAPAGDDRQGQLLASGRPFPPQQLQANIAQVDVGIEALRRAI
jgi:hypothetical protein